MFPWRLSDDAKMLLLPLLSLAGTQYIKTCVCVRHSSSSAMEKGVLLVLLCLSFLLITAFTATDAVALVEESENQRQGIREQRRQLCLKLVCKTPLAHLRLKEMVFF